MGDPEVMNLVVIQMNTYLTKVLKALMCLADDFVQDLSWLIIPLLLNI